jgi:hypothetical protein
MELYSFAELCGVVGRDAFAVRNLQRQLGLHVPANGDEYSYGYLVFLEKVVSLRALHVPTEKIEELFETEKKCLRLLHVDTLTKSPTWYLDACGTEGEGEKATDRLLLTGYRLGFPVDTQVIQHTFDFGSSGPELFTATEMGEDVRRVLRKYSDIVDGIRARVDQEKIVLRNALIWADQVFRRK